MKAAIDFSDALIMGEEKINPEIEKYLADSKKPVLDYQPITDNYIPVFNEFYDKVLGRG
jgi:starch synthase